MIRKVQLFFANFFWLLLSVRRSYCFRASTFDVEKAQKKVLLRIIKRNRGSVFGKEHGFASLGGIADYQARVGVRTYDLYKGYIDCIAEGRQEILTSDPVLLLEPSSGSTAGPKYIPYNLRLYEEFKNGLSPWIFDLLSKRKRLLLGSAYWSISPITKADNKGSTIPVGFGDDAAYFGKLPGRLLNTILSVPFLVSRIEDGESYKYVTLYFLLRDRNLAFISVWNPSFLMLLLEPLEKWSLQLIKDIERGTVTLPENSNAGLKEALIKKCYRDRKRAEELRRILAHDYAQETGITGTKTMCERIWPNLSLISCWGDSHAALHVNEIRRLFPNIEIQPKGLLATEGIVSFPLIGESGAALSIRSHFFEFIELKDRYENSTDAVYTKLAHQLEKGKLYSIVMTTGGGLYRYRLQDIIQVVGYKNQCPLARFISKESNISDVAGEKLNEFHVAAILKEAFNKYSLEPVFFLLAPERVVKKQAYFYALFLELKENNPGYDHCLFSLAQDLEKRLEENYHYAHCINLGQLLSVKLFVVNSQIPAAHIYVNTCREKGQKLGNIKPSVLSSRIGWSEYFEGRFIGESDVQGVYTCVGQGL
ncbi:MAG: GH3 auxin-responsive promoter family protein [Candidatus Omnitrophota bacterium]